MKFIGDVEETHLSRMMWLFSSVFLLLGAEEWLSNPDAVHVGGVTVVALLLLVLIGISFVKRSLKVLALVLSISTVVAYASLHLLGTRDGDSERSICASLLLALDLGLFGTWRARTSLD